MKGESQIEFDDMQKMKKINYPYIFEKMKKSIPLALVGGIVTALLFYIFSSKQVGVSGDENYGSYSSYYVNLDSSTVRDLGYMPGSNFTSYIGSDINSTYVRQGLLDHLEKKGYEDLSIYNIGDLISVTTTSTSFDIIIKTDNKELTSEISKYVHNYYCNMRSFCGIPVSITERVVYADAIVEGDRLVPEEELIGREQANNSVFGRCVMGFLVGFILVECVAVLLARNNNTIKNADDLRENTNLDIIYNYKADNCDVKNISTIIHSHITEDVTRVIFVPIGNCSRAVETVVDQLNDLDVVKYDIASDYKDLQNIKDAGNIIVAVKKETTDFNELKNAAELLNALDINNLGCVLL